MKKKASPLKKKAGVPAAKAKSNAGERQLISNLKAAVEAVSSAIMMVDRDLVVTYVNKTTMTMLEKHADEFRTLWSGFQPDRILGTCIDVFHKNPAHQRRLLADPKNLPHKTEITVGKLKFSLHVNASYDEHGNYVGCVLEWADVTELRHQEQVNFEYCAALKALDRSQAIIEFNMDGTIRTANDTFLRAFGYRLDEIQGRHHSMFCEETYRTSSEYHDFWARLNQGEGQNADYKRLGKGGREVWVQASYNPLIGPDGKPFKVVKYAVDITTGKRLAADQASQLESIGKYQAVIEFDLTGTIVHANNNFLAATGYALDEIVGRHHRVFCEPSYTQSPEYRIFWERLSRGEADSGQYKRLRKDRAEIWLQASYNPILDVNGKPCKVIKYATDISASKKLEQDMQRTMVETSRVMKSVADGELRESMEGTYSGEFAVLRDSVNSCIENLREMVEQIRNSSSVISDSATEIARGNADLSQRTEHQAGSIEETASSMEELTGTVKQNADNARQANQLASSAREQAEKGGSVVGQAVAAMSAINEASKKIADIIGVIDEIAFQTNLLALNAAVEAARAGEQGRGFAVVAAEVRNLAQRSAGAAKEIKTLIKDSVSKVEEGSRLVNESGATLQQIVGAVKKVSDVVAEIAEASSEQSAGLDRISEALAQMDQAVQQNAALVEQAAAASGSMDEQTRGLKTLMTYFKINENEEAEEVATKPAPVHKASAARPNLTKVAPVSPVAPKHPPARPKVPVRKPIAAAPVAKTSRAGAVAEDESAEGRWEEF